MRQKLLAQGYMDADYMGDGVYACHDGYQIWLLTTDGLSIQNMIALDDRTADAVIRYIKLFEEARKTGREIFPHLNKTEERS